MGYPHFLMRVDFCEEGCDDFSEFYILKYCVLGAIRVLRSWFTFSRETFGAFLPSFIFTLDVVERFV